jgi:hypothetical protein
VNPGRAPAAASPFRPRPAWLLVVVLAFWAAQMHGLAHGVSHLGRSHAAPHLALCADCLATASAGAAPAPAAVVIGPDTMPAIPAVARVAAPRVAAATAAYRSRAPPTPA